jgi:ABC-type Mn2+/Zn2+ transport system ATPase subunit
MKLVRQNVNQLLETRRAISVTLKKEQQGKITLTDRINNVEGAQKIIQSVAKTLQEKCHQQIASIVTRCLNAVFEDPYEFRMLFEQKRGKTEAKMVFIRDGIILDEPLHEVGGGVIDVAALGLRMACMLIQKPPVRRMLVMDEPFSHIRGAENRQRTRKMLLRMAEELGVQIILCTDIEDFKLGRVIEM